MRIRSVVRTYGVVHISGCVLFILLCTGSVVSGGAAAITITGICRNAGFGLVYQFIRSLFLYRMCTRSGESRDESARGKSRYDSGVETNRHPQHSTTPQPVAIEISSNQTNKNQRYITGCGDRFVCPHLTLSLSLALSLSIFALSSFFCFFDICACSVPVLYVTPSYSVRPMYFESSPSPPVPFAQPIS